MNGAQLHLAVNHLPVVGIFFGAVLLAGGLLFKSDALRRGALALLVLGGLSALPAFFTGEPAEEIVNRLPGMFDAAVDEHEKAADFALWAGLIVAAAAGAGLVLLKKRGSLPAAYFAALLVVVLWAAAVLARTAHLGGLIRHPEISDPTPPQP